MGSNATYSALLFEDVLYGYSNLYQAGFTEKLCERIQLWDVHLFSSLVKHGVTSRLQRKHRERTSGTHTNIYAHNKNKYMFMGTLSAHIIFVCEAQSREYVFRVKVELIFTHMKTQRMEAWFKLEHLKETNRFCSSSFDCMNSFLEKVKLKSRGLSHSKDWLHVYFCLQATAAMKALALFLSVSPYIPVI